MVVVLLRILGVHALVVDDVAPGFLAGRAMPGNVKVDGEVGADVVGVSMVGLVVVMVRRVEPLSLARMRLVAAAMGMRMVKLMKARKARILWKSFIVAGC